MVDDISTDEEMRDLVEQLQGGEASPQLVARLADLHPADQADVLEELTAEEGAELVRALPPEEGAELLEYMEDEETAAIAEQIPAAELAAILDEMALDKAADLLGDLSPAQQAALLPQMEEEAALRSLLAYPDETAGGLMVPIAFHLKATMSAATVLEVLRRAEPDPELIYYLFVEDEARRLVGVVSLRRLVIATPETSVREIMDSSVQAVNALTDQEECALLLQQYGLLALPVVDEQNRFLGVITVDDLVDVAVDEANEDTMLLGGLPGDTDAFDTFGESLRSRLPWLYVNLVTAFLAASVVSLFEETIARFAVLAVFQGIVAGQGGNAGTQTLTLMVRGLATGNLALQDARLLLRREALLGLTQGLAVAMVVVLVALLWKGDPRIALILGVAMVGNMTIANIAGVSIPLLLERLGVDPAVSSGVFVTTVTDICGFFFFLGLATWLLL